MFPPNVVEDAAEAEALWIAHCGNDNAPDNVQMRVWIRSCGMAALRHAIPLAGWKQRKCAEAGQPISPDGLQRYTSAACKRRSSELGFVREYQQCGDTRREIQRKPVDTFEVPQGWRDADDQMERIVVTGWDKA